MLLGYGVIIVSMIIDGVTMVTSSECAVSTVSESEAKEVCMSVYMRYLPLSSLLHSL